MTRDFQNRIPGNEVKSFDTWQVPVIDDPAKILSSAEKEDRERREKEARQKGEVIGEIVEDPELNGPITAAELERITEQAHQEGYQSGFDQGQEQGLKQGREQGQQQAYQEYKQRLSEHCDRLSTIVSGLVDPFEQETQSLQRIVLNSVLALSASVVKREFTVDSSEIAQFVNLALNALPKSAKDIIIHLHPTDIALLEEYFPDKVKQWSLVADTDISVGGVVIDSRYSKVDFSIENQLAQLGQQYIRGELNQTSIENDNESAIHDSRVVDDRPTQNNITQSSPSPPQDPFETKAEDTQVMTKSDGDSEEENK